MLKADCELTPFRLSSVLSSLVPTVPWVATGLRCAGPTAVPFLSLLLHFEFILLVILFRVLSITRLAIVVVLSIWISLWFIMAFCAKFHIFSLILVKWG